MKKSLFLLSFLVSLSLISFAQGTKTDVISYLPLAAGDTIVNTGTSIKRIPAITGSYAGLMIQCNLTVLSGTGAGTAQLQACLDSTLSTNWVNVGSAYTITATAAQSTTIYVAAPIAVYYRVLFTGSGVESTKVQVGYLRRAYGTKQFL